MIDDAARDPSEVQSLLASNLRRLRIARHLSLSELARATGMSKATLSSIESARANPTVDTLASLADALRVSLAELVEELSLDQVEVVRQGQGRVQQTNGISQRLIASNASAKALEITEVTFDPHLVREAEPLESGSRLHVYVLKGRLITGPVERPTEFRAGDYTSFPGDVSHVWETGREAARALVLSAARD